jgi:hypothetical protein
MAAAIVPTSRRRQAFDPVSLPGVFSAGHERLAPEQETGAAFVTFLGSLK